MRTAPSRICSLALVAAAMLQANLCHARTYYVGGAAAADSNAGTTTAPFKSMAHAAQIATAGDRVIIRPGVYTDPVTVRNSGQPDNPILFQALWPRSVTLRSATKYTLVRPAADPKGHQTAYYITFRGIVFGRTPFRGFSGFNDWPSSVVCSRGWRLEDCTIEQNMGFSFGNNRTSEGDGVTMLRTIIQDVYGTGGGAAGDGDAKPPRRLENVTLQDCIFRRNNHKDVDPGGYSGANKFLWTDHLTFDGVISYDNIGTGTWFDYASTNFTVQNCTFFGNHAGVGLNLSGKPGNDVPWAGAGFWSEANSGPAIIRNNVVYSNLASGIGDLDSGSRGKLVITGNTIVDCAASLEFRGMKDGGARGLGPAEVSGNVFKSWHSYAWNTSVEENIPSSNPAGMGIVIDGNTYDPTPGYAGLWASWKPSARPKPITAKSLADLRQKLGAEKHGRILHTEFRGPLIHVFPYPTAADAAHPVLSKLIQVPSAAAEHRTIERAFRGARAGDGVLVPVFGRKAIQTSGAGWTCDVYDLQARHLLLTISSRPVMEALERGVTPYAIIAPTYLLIRITRLDPYDFRGLLVGVGQPTR